MAGPMWWSPTTPPPCARRACRASAVPSSRDLRTHRAARPAPARRAAVRSLDRGGVRLHSLERGRCPVRAEARGPVDLAPVGSPGHPARDCDHDIRGDLVLAAAHGPDQASGARSIGACVRRLRVRPLRNGRHGRVPGMRAAVRFRHRSTLVGAGADAVARLSQLDLRHAPPPGAGRDSSRYQGRAASTGGAHPS